MPEVNRAMAGNEELTTARKSEHIRICLEEQVQGIGIRTGLENYRFLHNALPELAFDTIKLDTFFCDGTPMKAPLLVSSMTGGTVKAARINERLAEAAQARGWAMGLGSMRAAIEREDMADTFKVRHVAPTIPVIANLGAVQLNYGYGVDQCRRAVELAEANALVLHLNALQEVFQPEGDTDFSELLARIEEVCRKLEVPVGIKEVGWGIDADTADKLLGAGASFIDAAGAGGTSWSQVEKFRSADLIRREAAEAFTDWGIPTVESIVAIRERAPQCYLVASGGLETGVDAAKALGLGANLAGFGRTLLERAANIGTGDDAASAAERVSHQLERIELELRIAMFGIGASNLYELGKTKRLVRI